MSEIERKQIVLPEICRVEGHSAVTVDIQEGQVVDVQLDVFEGTRFFERIVLGHRYDEIPHVTSRVCAICSTGHVLAAIRAIERVFGHSVNEQVNLFRELMHLGMIIESHATHICALALPDFLNTPDLLDFASKHPHEFEIWTRLRKLGASIQTTVGGRPFHPVNLHVGGLSRYPSKDDLRSLLSGLSENHGLAVELCRMLLDIRLPVKSTAKTEYVALVPDGEHYGYFGERVRSSSGWESDINEYKDYLGETVVSYSHAKQSRLAGKPFMVGSMARLALFGDRLGREAASFYQRSPLARGETNTILNNLAQSIEIIEAIDRATVCIEHLLGYNHEDASAELKKVQCQQGKSVGAVECPRGTLYHFYEFDASGVVLAADMITPSAQNTARIECDIRVVAQQYIDKQAPDELQASLETLVRAYDPCNTCATHMVQVKYSP